MREQADLSGLPARPPDRAGAARASSVYRPAGRRTPSARRPTCAASSTGCTCRYTPYYLVNGVEVDGGPAVRAWLSRRDDVGPGAARASGCARCRPSRPPTRGDDPAPTGPQWNIAMIGADRVWSAARRRPAPASWSAPPTPVWTARIRRCATGSGAATTPGTTRGTAPARPTDHGGHGTHTLGSRGRAATASAWPRTRSGSAASTSTATSATRPATWTACSSCWRPFPHGGDPFTDGRPERAPHVLTNSWGCPPIEGCDAGALRPATAALAAAGIFFVAAAGNTGPLLRLDRRPAGAVRRRAHRRRGRPRTGG